VARIHHAPHRGQVTWFEFGDAIARALNAADNLMARHAGINGVVPFIPDMVQVRVADPAVENFNFNI
jgi:hypothetical protein